MDLPAAGQHGSRLQRRRHGQRTAEPLGDARRRLGVRGRVARARRRGNIAGEAGTIGGDASAWYSGYTTDVATTVGLWDQTVDAKGRTVVHSLDHLGGVGAAQSVLWPTGIWQNYMQAVTGGHTQPFPAPTSGVWGADGAPAPVQANGPSYPENPVPVLAPPPSTPNGKSSSTPPPSRSSGLPGTKPGERGDDPAAVLGAALAALAATVAGERCARRQAERDPGALIHWYHWSTTG
ncbi:hypothetical protein GXW82_41905 [Streptacidiphilus sp. 4-A2]|nr:hypothetical protein [Streptacidiphilus sp. 4-A2]